MEIESFLKNEIEISLQEAARSNPRLTKKFITAYDFAWDYIGTSGKPEYSFNIDRSNLVAQLRKLADKVEAGSILVINTQVATEAGFEEWTKSALVVTFVEKVS